MVPRANQRGAAIVVALFMMLLVTALGAAMVHVARTETLSSASYTSMSQGRYAAEAGVAAAANYLLSSAYANVMPGTPGDPIENYNINVSPVTRNGAPVVLSSDAAVESNYPSAAVIAAFQGASSGTLQVGGTASYNARATLIRMRKISDGITGESITLQSWEIAGIGRRATGEIAGEAEVSAIIERTTRPVFNYAAFATANGCNALTLTGVASTDSYDSSQPVTGPAPQTSPDGGHVGTNGNLGATGQAQVNGTLSTPMTGIGACTANNVTAASLGPGTAITEGLIQLSQPIEFPTQPPNTTPVTTNQMINSASCGSLPNCTTNAGKVVFTPVGNQPVLLGNVTINGGQQVVLKSGTYYVNSMTLAGGGQIAVDASSGEPVIIQLIGEGLNTNAKVFDITGNGIANDTWNPSMLRIQYHGDRQLQFDGNGNTAALIYAPNAHATLAGTADFYGSIITRTVDSVGSAKLHYDKNLQNTILTAGNPVMTSFTWHTF